MNPTALLRTLSLCGALLLPASGCDGSLRRPPESDDSPGGRLTFDLARPVHSRSMLDAGGDVFAIHRIEIGTPPNKPSPGAPTWAEAGFDLDRTATLGDPATRSCAPPITALSGSDIDGPGGVDNAFGRTLALILGAATGPLETTANDALAAGTSTLLFDVDGLGGTVAGFEARVYIGAPLGAPPRLDGTQVWPVAYESVRDGDIDSPLVTLRGPPLTDDGEQATCAATSGDAIEIRLAARDPSDHEGELRLRVRSPIVAMHLSADGARLTGILGGKLLLSDVRAEATRYFTHVASFLCEGDLLPTILAQIDRLADIRGDDRIDPDLPCDAISFGVGFEAARVHLGEVARPIAGLPDPCAM